MAVLYTVLATFFFFAVMAAVFIVGIILCGFMMRRSAEEYVHRAREEAHRPNRGVSVVPGGPWIPLSGSTGLSSFEIAAFPSFPYQKNTDHDDQGRSSGEGGEDEPRQSSICCEPLAEGEMVKALPTCAHKFHVKCIDEWLQNRPTCPECRAEARPSSAAPAAAGRVAPFPPA